MKRIWILLHRSQHDLAIRPQLCRGGGKRVAILLNCRQHHLAYIAVRLQLCRGDLKRKSVLQHRSPPPLAIRPQLG